MSLLRWQQPLDKVSDPYGTAVAYTRCLDLVAREDPDRTYRLKSFRAVQIKQQKSFDLGRLHPTTNGLYSRGTEQDTVQTHFEPTRPAFNPDPTLV